MWVGLVSQQDKANIMDVMPCFKFCRALTILHFKAQESQSLKCISITWEPLQITNMVLDFETLLLEVVLRTCSPHVGTELSLLLPVELCFLSAWSDLHNDSSFSFLCLVFSSCFFNRSRCSNEEKLNFTCFCSWHWQSIIMSLT